MHWPLATSHNRAVLSSDPVANVFPSALNATLDTKSECPLRTQHEDYGSCRGKGHVERKGTVTVSAGDDGSSDDQRYAACYDRKLPTQLRSLH